MSKLISLRAAFFALLLALVPFRAFAFDDFKPVAPEELSMKDNPKQPGAHAMILEMSDAEDDMEANSFVYKRIKIFTEEGKKYADVEIPYLKGSFSYSQISRHALYIPTEQ